MIKWGRGEGETLSIHVVCTRCALGLRDVADTENLHMSSFDVSDLFTNVPLDETINICLDSFYTGSNDTILLVYLEIFSNSFWN